MFGARGSQINLTRAIKTICTAEPATAELAQLPKQPWTLLVRAVKRRKEKEMALRISN